MFGHWGGFGISLASVLASLLFLGLIVLAVVLITRTVGSPGRPAAPTTAHQILAERFARGEIDAEEYQERLRVLNGEPPPERP